MNALQELKNNYLDMFLLKRNIEIFDNICSENFTTVLQGSATNYNPPFDYNKTYDKNEARNMFSTVIDIIVSVDVKNTKIINMEVNKIKFCIETTQFTKKGVCNIVDFITIVVDENGKIECTIHEFTGVLIKQY